MLRGCGGISFWAVGVVVGLVGVVLLAAFCVVGRVLLVMGAASTAESGLPRWWEGGGVDPWRGVAAPGLRRFATRRMKLCEPGKARKEVSGGEMDGKVGVSAYSI